MAWRRFELLARYRCSFGARLSEADKPCDNRVCDLQSYGFLEYMKTTRCMYFMKLVCNVSRENLVSVVFLSSCCCVTDLCDAEKYLGEFCLAVSYLFSSEQRIICTLSSFLK